MNRPETTLFMLTSVDGKISTGDTDVMDFDRDLKTITGVKEGLHQYYELEQQTDLVSLNSGRVMAKIGVNDREDEPKKMPVSFVIIDNEPNLTASGVLYLSKWVTKLILVTTNKLHPALFADLEDVAVFEYVDSIDFHHLFERLRLDHGVERITVQSGGSLNAQLLRDGLIDHLSLVIAPLLVGGRSTPTLVDGESLHSLEDLRTLKTLELVKCDVLENNYLHLQYDVR